MTDYAAVLLRNYKGAEWSLNGSDYSGLVWRSDTPMPTQEELDLAWPAVRDAQAWDRVRAERDALLAASDWVTLRAVESGSAVDEAWAVYRQALRDVPQQFDNPDAVVWPEEPV